MWFIDALSVDCQVLFRRLFSFTGLFGKVVRQMKLVKKINTSAALAMDRTGHEIVVMGKGIGFPQMPYKLDDLSKIERTFYDVDPKYLGMIAELSQPIVMVCADIADQAGIELDCSLNPNLPFTLADHIQFAAERLKKGVDLTTPIAYDIRHLYPREAAMADMALKMLNEQTGMNLPASEAISIAMHFINAEAESGDMHSLMLSMQVIAKVNEIVESSLHIQLDKDSYNYSRFATHLRYLIQRLQAGVQTDNISSNLRRTLMREYPDIYACTLKVVEYLKNTYGWDCNDDEVVYLIMHIQRVYEREQE